MKVSFIAAYLAYIIYKLVYMGVIYNINPNLRKYRIKVNLYFFLRRRQRNGQFSTISLKNAH